MSTLRQTAEQTHLGAYPFDTGVEFGVWAPHADSVAVIGDFSDWDKQPQELDRDEGGCWRQTVEGAKVGDGYLFLIRNGDEEFRRIDPRAREVTNSVGHGIVRDEAFDWGADGYELPDHNKLVIYELHVGTFNRNDDEDGPGGFDAVAKKLDYLQSLGVNAIQLMPLSEFAGDLSWGYNPAHLFAVESAYGGPDALKRLVKTAHERGIGVILDVVYNHFGPSDLDLWQFDGWSEDGKGGIYFYNDWRSSTPWGETRPDYGREEVRNFIHDNAMMWLRDYRMDGLRYDMTLYIRSVDASGTNDIPEGWNLTQRINGNIKHAFPRSLLVAEDLQRNDWLTKKGRDGGANFDSQWDAEFVHPVRRTIAAVDDRDRSMMAIRNAVCHRYNFDAFERVIYTESHDEVANGKSRLPSEIDEENPDSYFAKKRSTLAAALMFTTPGIPMLFQAQEFLRDEWFRDTRPIDWRAAEEYDGIVQLYRDLIGLRLNRDGFTRGLTGSNIDVRHLNDIDKVIAFRRWDQGGEGDDTLVVMNFSSVTFSNYRIGVTPGGEWRLRLNSDSSFYSTDFGGGPVGSLNAMPGEYDGLPYSAEIRLPAYTALIYSQDA